MYVDIESLGTFNRLADEGAHRAATAMSQMTGIDARVDVTTVSLLERSDVGEALGDRELVGVTFDYEGDLSGETVLVFERACTEPLAEALVAGVDGEGMSKSSVLEIGNIMVSGFIDGWADYLGTAIDHSPPAYVEGVGAEVLPEAPHGDDTDHVFVFKSRIEWVGARHGGEAGVDGLEDVAEPAEFYIYMLPEYAPLARVMAEHADSEDGAIPVDKLGVFNQMTRDGAERAASNISTMTGIDTTVDVSRISFAPVEDIPRQVGTDTYLGTVAQFTGVPSGYMAVLFDEDAAVDIATAMLPVDATSAELTDQHEAAIEELGNILISGFVDGWANVLETSIDHTPPRLIHDMGRAIMDPLAAQVGRDQDHAFVFDSTMRADGAEFGAQVYALPREQELRDALATLEVGRAGETDPDVDGIFQE